MKDLILGTAGHIDHGKSSLIRALTGVDPDRLPEEKKRGITIELGFAELCLDEYRFGIVDVPGHERFIRNMLAGAAGMDLALLVIAADDSIKPQTREHLDILKMLDLQAGVIALTKRDLADSDWIELVKEEIAELVADSFLESASVIEVSAKTGQGLDELKRALVKAAKEIDDKTTEPRIDSPFRMAIDRVFTIAGHGTVVTGSVVSGSTQVGDELVLQPGAKSVRIRGLQNHDRVVDEIHRGQRAAINLSGVHHQELERGQELCAPGFLVSSDLIDVKFSLLPHSKAIKDRQRLRVHLGTLEIPATLRLIDHASEGVEEKQIASDQHEYAQLFLRDRAVSSWHQPFVLRDDSAQLTLGGGVILHPNATRQKRWTDLDRRMLKQLDSAQEIDRVSAAFYFAEFEILADNDVRRITGSNCPDIHIKTLLDDEKLLQFHPTPSQTQFIHRDRLRAFSEQIAKGLEQLHDRNPLQSKFDEKLIRHRFDFIKADGIFQLALRVLVEQKRIKYHQGSLSLVGKGPQLSKNEQKLLEELIEQFHQAGLSPPTIADCQSLATKNKESVPQLIDLAIANGELERISNDIVFHAETVALIKEKVAAALSERPQGLTMAEIRDSLETTRKFAVPICEFLDRIGFTKRVGDRRVLTARTTSSEGSDKLANESKT